MKQKKRKRKKGEKKIAVKTFEGNEAETDGKNANKLCLPS